MTLALVTNAGPRSNDALRLNALTPNLAREAPPAAAAITLFAPEPAAFAAADAHPFAAVHPLPDHTAAGHFLARHRFDLVLLDYDATAGSHRDRTGFLRLATALLRAAGDCPVAVLASESNAFPESVHLSVAAARNRNAFQRLLEQAPLRLAFSGTLAARLGEKCDGEIRVLPCGSPVPAPSMTRARARAELGFPETRQDVLVGLLARHGELNFDWFVAGCSEVFRVAPSVRLLYIGPDGELIRQHRFPIPLLDAGTPSPEELSVRLCAMDFAILPAPVRGEARPDRLGLTACLQHGVPVVGAIAPAASGIDSLFGKPPPGLALVPGNNLGAFLEAVESCCQRVAEHPSRRQADTALADYYQRQLSGRAALEQLSPGLAPRA